MCSYHTHESVRNYKFILRLEIVCTVPGPSLGKLQYEDHRYTSMVIPPQYMSIISMRGNMNFVLVSALVFQVQLKCGLTFMICATNFLAPYGYMCNLPLSVYPVWVPQSLLPIANDRAVDQPVKDVFGCHCPVWVPLAAYWWSTLCTVWNASSFLHCHCSN